jgi:predicted  nucleic acid-binding Zn-ribbon protein
LLKVEEGEKSSREVAALRSEQARLQGIKEALDKQVVSLQGERNALEKARTDLKLKNLSLEREVARLKEDNLELEKILRAKEDEQEHHKPQDPNLRAGEGKRGSESEGRYTPG